MCEGDGWPRFRVRPPGGQTYKKKGRPGATRLPLFEPGFRLGRKGRLRVVPGGRPRPGRPLFGGVRHGVDRHIFAAELAVVESDAAVRGREQRVVLAHADVDARIDLGPALAHDDVAADHVLTAELLHAKAAAG